MEKQERSSFSSRVGFVLAASGSAVGLGNLWRFPYLAARYGGGIFLLVYLILVVTFGFSLMITEFAIGRKTKLSCIGAYGALDKRFNFLGWIAAFVPLIITPYYCYYNICKHASQRFERRSVPEGHCICAVYIL